MAREICERAERHAGGSAIRPRMRARLTSFLTPVTVLLAISLVTCGNRPACAGVEQPDRPLPVRIGDLISKTYEFDGRLISFEGEVIGDVMFRGDSAWVNVLDSSGAIGVVVTRDMASQVENTGAYAVKGDIVRVTGVFHRACSVHAGEIDVHAESFQIVRRGGPVRHAIAPGRIVMACTLLGAAVVLAYAARIKGRLGSPLGGSPKTS
ncbi:MAG: hypothetical protein IMW97_08870 [Firmicutes bacterium]|nr:hypothetical protein [Candidatus Fermentithermobacillaceae bacterium]